MTRLARWAFYGFSLISAYYLGLYVGKASTGSPGTFIDAMAGIGSFAFFVVTSATFIFQQARGANLRFYFWWEKQRARWLSRRSALWTIYVRFAANWEDGLVDRVQSALIARYSPNHVRVVTSSANARTVLVRGLFSLDIMANPGESPDEDQEISVTLSDLRVGYAEAEDRLEQDVMPLLNEFHNLASPTSESYKLSVQFDPRDNPFLGLYLRLTQPADIASFQVVLMLTDQTDGGKSAVEVTRDGIALTARSLLGLQARAVEFLSLAPTLARLSRVAS